MWDSVMQSSTHHSCAQPFRRIHCSRIFGRVPNQRSLNRADTRSTDLASDQKPHLNFNTEGQLGAEQIREQTRNAIDTYFGFLRQSIASVPSGGTV